MAEASALVERLREKATASLTRAEYDRLAQHVHAF